MLLTGYFIILRTCLCIIRDAKGLCTWSNIALEAHPRSEHIIRGPGDYGQGRTSYINLLICGLAPRKKCNGALSLEICAPDICLSQVILFLAAC